MIYCLHPDAAAELNLAIAYYAEQGGASVSSAFIKEVRRVANLLTTYPHFGTPASSSLRAYPLRRFPYSLIYFPSESEIEILAVAHQHRRPGYWQSRGL